MWVWAQKHLHLFWNCLLLSNPACWAHWNTFRFWPYHRLAGYKSTYLHKSCIKYPQRTFKMYCIETFHCCCSLDIVLMTLFSMTWLFVKWHHTYRHSVHFVKFPSCFEALPYGVRVFKWALIIFYRERSGSVVECLTWDRGAAGSSLTGITALWSLSRTHLS